MNLGNLFYIIKIKLLTHQSETFLQEKNKIYHNTERPNRNTKITHVTKIKRNSPYQFIIINKYLLKIYKSQNDEDKYLKLIFNIC